MFAAQTVVKQAAPRLLKVWTERGRWGGVRIEYVDTDGVTRTTFGILCDGYVRWGYDVPPDDVDVLAYLVAYDAGEHTFPEVEYEGTETRAEMESAVERMCFPCGARVDSVDDLSDRGECPKCFVARMGAAS